MRTQHSHSNRIRDRWRRWRLLRWRRRSCRCNRRRRRRFRSRCQRRWRWRCRFRDFCYRSNQNLVVRIDPVWIDNVLIHFPQLWPQLRILHHLPGDPRQSFSLCNDVGFKLIGIGRHRIRTDVPVRLLCQILRWRSLHRGCRSLGKDRNCDQQRDC